MRCSAITCMLLAATLLLAQVHTVDARVAKVTWGLTPVVTVSGPGRSYNVATKILRVCKGDSVTFRWAGDTPHNVVSVPAWAWSACGLASTTTIAPVSMSGSKTVKFRVGSKSYSYICSVFGHCEMGQRLRVSVSSWCK